MMHADEPLLARSTFEGAYEILGELGAGSFSRVYSARQVSTGQEVALKVLRFRPSDDPAWERSARDRLRREIRLCTDLAHPNIVRLIDAGERDDGLLYAVMQLVPGTTLREILGAGKPLALAETIHLMGQVLDALSCAHARGIVHRDLKPENIMVTKTGARRNALVVDFGLAGFEAELRHRALPRITATGELLGTPSYAAPEQLRGEPPSTRSDLYSWGLVFLECLTGETVFDGVLHEVIARQFASEPVPIPVWLRHYPLGRLLRVVTEKSVDRRNVTAETLLRGLEGALLPESESGAAAAAERRQLTVVACRFTVPAPDGDTRQGEDIDSALQTKQALCADVATRFGGELAGATGNRLLLVFGLPRAREDDARRAARAALAIAAESGGGTIEPRHQDGVRLDTRIGVHTGIVLCRRSAQTGLVHLDRLLGLTAAIADRLSELAAPGEVVVSGDTGRLQRGELASEPAGECVLTEVGATVPGFRLCLPQPPQGIPGPGDPELPLVGRLPELDRLSHGAAEARRGRGGVAMLVGEPGMGKSRLLRELRRLDAGTAWLEWQCTAENANTPLRPIIDVILARKQPLESLLAQYRLDLAETLPLMAALLSLPLPDTYVPRPLSPERQKELTSKALLELVVRMSEEQPLTLAIENLHWADPTTLDLVGELIQEMRAARALAPAPGPRLYIVCTCRPEFTAPWSSEGIDVIQLRRLERPQVREMITRGFAGGEALPPAVIDQVVQRTDGVPLFVEEITHLLLGTAGRPGGAPFGDVAAEVPATLRDLLCARLDGLSPSARETALLAAVLGREFRDEVLLAVSAHDEATLADDVRELASAGLAHRRPLGGVHVFRHALLRDAAYDSLTQAARQELHLHVATTLQRRFPDLERQRPDTLAFHFERGARLEAAVQYWQRAAARGLQRAAYREALAMARRAMDVLAALPDGADRRPMELELLSTFGAVVSATKGYAAPESEAIYTRAWELCGALGDDVPRHVLFGLGGVYLARSDRQATATLLPLFRRLISDSSDPVSQVTASACAGLACFWAGEFPAAHEHFERGSLLFRTEVFQEYAATYGTDSGLNCLAFDMVSMWHLGHCDRAEQMRLELLVLAERAGDPSSMCYALGLGTVLAHDRGDHVLEHELGRRLSTIAEEQRFPVWRAAGACALGGSLLLRGYARDALAPLEEGIDLFGTIGLFASYSAYHPHLAEAYRQLGEIGRGLATVERGLELCRSLLCCYPEPELLRIRAELRMLEGASEAAENDLRRALEIARHRGAKSYELRAATALARLARGDDRAAARAALAETYASFTEGFDTADLRAARAVLADDA